MKSIVLILTMTSLMVSSCELFETSAQYTYTPPAFVEDGLEVGSLENMDVELDAIEKAVSEITGGRYEEVHSLLIIKDNKLVLDEYFTGHEWKWDAPSHHGNQVEWEMTMPHNIHSAAKSLTSACIGIAIDKGFIESANESIFEYLPDHQHLRKNGKERITIEHLLTMTSGLKWREWSAPYSSGENPVIDIWFQELDPVTYILEKPLVNEPGTAFNYSTGNMILLGEILRFATSLDIDDFSNTYLFQPLGIDSSSWPEVYPNGALNNTLYITPRAMAKFGLLYLNKGMWNGQRIVSEEWVERSRLDYPGNHDIDIPGEASGKMGYSYSWWTKSYNEDGKTIHMYTASGFGGQHIMVLPEVSSVVVFTGGNYVSRRPTFKILKKYIIPALVN
jgi:CubicO group peptidase (beta-lactamase class C family)